MNRKIQNGFITLIIIFMMAVIATLLLALGYSRLLLALQRNQSASDTLISTYRAESEINDYILKLLKGYLDDSDFPIHIVLDNGVKVEIEGKIQNGFQTITVTADKFFATSSIQATRGVTTSNQAEGLELILALDCTTSMMSPPCNGTSCQGRTRFMEQERAAISFVESLKEYQANIKLGVAVFTRAHRWFKNSSGIEITPNSGLSFDQIKQALDEGFVNGTTSNGTAWSDHKACTGLPTPGTSVGSGFKHANEYFAANPVAPNTKRAVFLITDGRPNASIPYNKCPNVPNPLSFLKCTLAKSDQVWDTNNNLTGTRNPSVLAYAITVLTGSDAQQEVIDIFRTYADWFRNTPSAEDLTGILRDALTDIISSTSIIKIKRISPNLP